jgi:UDP-N-acetyl-D-glucosamine dehydrogenase
MPQRLKEKIKERTATVGIIGLGYVGLPLAIEFVKKGFPVIGYDNDPKKVNCLNEGKTYIKHISDWKISEVIGTGRFIPVTDEKKIREMDAILICVPTPLTPQREPDMSYVIKSCELITGNMRSGQLIVLESTTYPGTTDGVMKPILERGGLKCNEDFYLAYSPEREDPNNKHYNTETIPKVVGCDSKDGIEAVRALYDAVVTKTVPVSSTRTAEATKLVENIYRSVNIALVNELKMLFTEMDIDIWEVIEAAATKPFGFQPFYPGPGLGGHCIPIDPFYLTWKAREYDMPTKFIELAGEINTHMPRYVVSRVSSALNDHHKALRKSKILIVGLAYKKDIDDMRESPSLKLMTLLEERGAHVDYHDPFIPEIPSTREHLEYAGRKSVSFDRIEDYDCVLIATDHSEIPYDEIVNRSKLIVDTRHAIPDLTNYENVVRA